MLKSVVFLALLVGGIGIYGQQPAPSKPPDVVRAAPAPESPKPWYLRTEVDALVIAGIGVLITSAISLFTLLQIRKQTGRMARQADLTNRQLKIEIESLTVAREAANAAKESADAAKRSAEVAAAQTKAMTDRERARLYVEKPLNQFTLDLNQRPHPGGVAFNIRNVASTPAVNIKATYYTSTSESESPPEKATFSTVMDIPDVVAGNDQIKGWVLFHNSFPGQPRATFSVHLWGCVDYNDVMTGEPHQTTFRFRIYISNNSGIGIPRSGWFTCGRPEDNKVT